MQNNINYHHHVVTCVLILASIQLSIFREINECQNAMIYGSDVYGSHD